MLRANGVSALTMLIATSVNACTSFSARPPRSSATQPCASQARSCLLMVSRLVPTISASSCWVAAILRRRAPAHLLLEVIGGDAQPRAEKLDQTQRRLWLVPQELEEVAALDDDEVAFRHGDS